MSITKRCHNALMKAFEMEVFTAGKEAPITLEIVQQMSQEELVDILPELKQRGFLALILEKVLVVSKRLFLLPSLVPPNEVLFGLHKRFFVSRHVLPRHFSSLLQR